MSFKILVFEESGELLRAQIALYEWWEAEAVGAGGGGGGAPATGPGQGSAGGGGAGGGYSRSYGQVADLPQRVVVTVGLGGTPGVGSDPNEVSHRGGDSAFGSFAKGQGGRGGGGSPASERFDMRLGGSPGVGSKGYLNIPGQPGEHGIIGPRPSRGGQGGHSHLGSGGRTPGLNGDGRSPLGGYGGGGSGASNGPNQIAVRSGGRGAGGVVIVRLYS